MIDYSKLNPSQYEATMHVNGPLLILAGAGTGKTATLTYRLAHLLEEGISPENILLLTFTNKAANEMQRRAQSMLGTDYDLSNLMASTYHSFAVKILKQYGSSIGLRPSFTIADNPTSKDIIKMIKEDLRVEDLSSSFLLSLFSLSANLQEDLEELVLDKFNKSYHQFDMIEDVYKEYVEYKKEKDILDYDDLLVKLLELLSKDRELCKNLSSKYQYILVDEYQDSNSLQFDILCKLCQTHDNLCVVGDDSQSIYSWRGANFKNILNFPKQFPKCHKVILDTNYRSVQPVLNVANEIVENMAEKFEKKLTSGRKGKKPMLCYTKDKYEENNFCVNIIENKIASHVPLNEICVLARNSASLNMLEFTLKSKGIPYKKYGGLKFLEKAHVRDCFGILRVLVNLNDEISWLRILTLMPNLGMKSAQKIFEVVQDEGFEGLLNKKFDKKKYTDSLLSLYSLFSILSTSSFEEQLRLIIDYLAPIYRKNKAYKDNWKTRLDELEVFFDLTAKYKDAEEFLDDVVLNGTDDGDEKDSVTLSTIHSAKGLEFNTVVILDCVEGVLPSNRDSAFDDAEEDKRLLYVAITRAKDSLYLIYPERSYVNGKLVKNYKLSSFLSESNVNSKLQQVKF